MQRYTCACGATELWQDREPFACSRCQKCFSRLTADGSGGEARTHRILEARCVHCGRPEAVLRRAGVPEGRISR